MNLNRAMFHLALARRVDSIKRLCKTWGIPELGSRVTLILRDPTNDAMSFVVTDETTLADAYRVARHLEVEHGVADGIPQTEAAVQRMEDDLARDPIPLPRALADPPALPRTRRASEEARAMTPEEFRALCARVWARQAPSSRWLVVPREERDNALERNYPTSFQCSS